MNAVIAKAGLSEKVTCDSAGTMDWHTGKSPDSRMIQAAAEHGYTFQGAARQIRDRDFKDFDLILAMDRANLTDILARGPQEEDRKNVQLFSTYCTGDRFPEEVPDPYYGGEEGFHFVIEMIENGCAGLLEHVKEQLPT